MTAVNSKAGTSLNGTNTPREIAEAINGLGGLSIIARGTAGSDAAQLNPSTSFSLDAGDYTIYVSGGRYHRSYGCMYSLADSGATQVYLTTNAGTAEQITDTTIPIRIFKLHMDTKGNVTISGSSTSSFYMVIGYIVMA